MFAIQQVDENNIWMIKTITLPGNIQFHIAYRNSAKSPEYHVEQLQDVIKLYVPAKETKSSRASRPARMDQPGHSEIN